MLNDKHESIKDWSEYDKDLNQDDQAKFQEVLGEKRAQYLKRSTSLNAKSSRKVKNPQKVYF